MDKHALSSSTRVLVSVLVALLAFAVLAPAAFAQSAGDRQYADPLGGGGGGQDAAPQQPQGGDTPTSSDDPPSQAAPGDATPLPPGAEPALTGAGETLPRTGATALPAALLGCALLLLGLAARQPHGAASRRP
jgi:hypothetical protein